MKILLPLSWLYALIVAIRNWLYDHQYLASTKLPGTVISIGNIAVGGTGKSPVVIDVVSQLKSQGGIAAIVTRGYRSGLKRGEWQVLIDGNVVAGVTRDNVIADEAIMQSRALPGVPVIVGSDRLAAIEGFLTGVKYQAITHWILDDGFQHRKIARDLDIVLLDARHPAGALIPADYFREPLSALRRATAVLLTKADDHSQLMNARDMVRRVAPRCPVVTVSFQVLPPALKSGRGDAAPSKWCLVAGIAKPQDFEKAAASVGIVPSKTRFFDDHEAISPSELSGALSDCDGVLTTEKDWSRSEGIFRSLGVPVFVLPLAVRWEDSPAAFLRLSVN